MAEYIVTYSKQVEIEADSLDEAEDKAIESLLDGFDYEIYNTETGKIESR